jgi:hypothetical protein
MSSEFAAETTTELSDAVNLKMREVWPYKDDIAKEAKLQRPEVMIILSDVLAGRRYLNKTLWNLGDPYAVLDLHVSELFELWVGAAIGASIHRIEGPTRNLKNGRKRKRRQRRSK